MLKAKVDKKHLHNLNNKIELNHHYVFLKDISCIKLFHPFSINLCLIILQHDLYFFLLVKFPSHIKNLKLSILKQFNFLFLIILSLHWCDPISKLHNVVFLNLRYQFNYLFLSLVLNNLYKFQYYRCY